MKVTLLGNSLRRPKPTSEDSILCKFGFHSMVKFRLAGLQDATNLRDWPRYCRRCNHTLVGSLLPYTREEFDGVPTPPLPPRCRLLKDGKGDVTLEYYHDDR